MYNEPLLNRKKIHQLTKIHITSVKEIINMLVERNILVETTGYSRNQVFAFQKYIDLFLK